MSEIDQIRYDNDIQFRLDTMHYKFALLLQKDPSGIIWANMSDDMLNFWINKSIEFEFYDLTQLFNVERQKRCDTIKY